MIPQSPVLKKSPHVSEVVFAKNQPPYISLPVIRSQSGRVTARFALTWRERLQVLLSGSIWLTLLTFNSPLQPVKLSTVEPTPTECEVD